MGYLQANGTPEEVKEGYHTVCPVYAAEATEPFAAFTGMPLILPAVAAGHRGRRGQGRIDQRKGMSGHARAGNMPRTGSVIG